MKSLVAGAFLILTVSSSGAQSAIVCEGDTNMGKVVVSLEKNAVTVSGAALSNPVTFPNVSEVWDGHMTGLVTAPGFSMKYENHYGCIRNVVIATNLRNGGGVGYIGTTNISACKGGSTSDKICLR